MFMNLRDTIFTTTNRTKEKLKHKGGVTLVEMLMAVIVLILATGLITLALDFGISSFNKSNMEAEGQILCSTLATAVKDELRFARNIEGSEISDIKFFSMNLGAKDCSFKVENSASGGASGAGYIMLKTPKGSFDLVPKSTYVYGLGAEFARFEWDENASPRPAFSIEIEVRAEDGTRISSEEFTVEPLNFI